MNAPMNAPLKTIDGSGDIAAMMHAMGAQARAAAAVQHPDIVQLHDLREHEGRGYWSGDRWTDW